MGESREEEKLKNWVWKMLIKNDSKRLVQTANNSNDCRKLTSVDRISRTNDEETNALQVCITNSLS